MKTTIFGFYGIVLKIGRFIDQYPLRKVIKMSVTAFMASANERINTSFEFGPCHGEKFVR